MAIVVPTCVRKGPTIATATPTHTHVEIHIHAHIHAHVPSISFSGGQRLH